MFNLMLVSLASISPLGLGSLLGLVCGKLQKKEKEKKKLDCFQFNELDKYAFVSCVIGSVQVD